MADRDTKIRPFMFDVNNFDESKVVEAPPPSFTELELETAKRDAFEQGRKAGHAEAKAQREKFVADLLETIKHSFATLFDAESKRASLYEAETLFLSRAIFTRLFPSLNERHGLDETMRAIVSVLEGQRASPEIIIEVNPEYTNDVRDHITQTLKSVNEGVFTITGNADLGPGDCRMRWEDGGAGRSAARICEQIGNVFELTLADRAILRDNKDSVIDAAAPAVAAPPEEINNG